MFYLFFKCKILFNNINKILNVWFSERISNPFVMFQCLMNISFQKETQIRFRSNLTRFTISKKKEKGLILEKKIGKICSFWKFYYGFLLTW